MSKFFLMVVVVFFNHPLFACSAYWYKSGGGQYINFPSQRIDMGGLLQVTQRECEDSENNDHHISLSHLSSLGQYIDSAGKKHNVDPLLIRAVIHAESSYNSTALSPKGAMGLMQLMGSTAKQYGVIDAYHPEQNINGGTAYLRVLLNKYKGDNTKALAAYNAGEKAVDKANGIPNYPETKAYVRRVLTLYDSYKKEAS